MKSLPASAVETLVGSPRGAQLFIVTRMPRPKAKEVLLLLAANDIRAVSLAGTSPGMLDLFEEVDREIPLKGRRWVLGHISVLTLRDIERIARMGIVLTTHTNSNIYKQGHLWQQRLPKERHRSQRVLLEILGAWRAVELGPTDCVEAIPSA